MNGGGQSNGPWQGQGPDLHTALTDAWNNAKQGGANPGTYTVDTIEIVCNNPISTYVVTIKS